MNKFLPVAIVAGAVALFLVTAGNVSADSTFVPKTYAHLCNSMPADFPDAHVAGAGQTIFEPNCAENLQTGAFADVTLTTDLAAVNVGIAEQITFFPSSSAVTLGSSNPAGAKLGGSRIIESFSLSGGPCSTVFSTDFILYNVALPNNTGDPRASTNIAFPRNEGQADRFGAWQIGSPPANGGPDNVTDANGDTRADGTTLSIQNYPSHLLDTFDPDKTPGGADGPLPPLLPRAVYGGLSLLMGEWQPLYLVQFSPGQLAALPGHYSLMASAMGHPLVFLQGDPSATMISPSAITDRCTPLTATTLLRGRDPSLAHIRYTNAVCTSSATQCTHFIVKYLASLRDTDQDGFENAIDSCPRQVNAGSPKTGAGDSDSDGLDDVCDPTPLQAGADPDGDAYANRGDNCPLDSNPGQTESEASVVPPDRGPRRDEIGDPCDTGTISVTQNGRTFNLTLSPTVANGRYHVAANHVAKCYGATSAGGTDADGDGYCSTQDNADSGACETTAYPNNQPFPGTVNSCPVRHVGWNSTYASALRSGVDSDGDGWTDVQETYLGTDPTRACQQHPEYPAITGGANNESPLDNWPMDYNDDGVANTIDVGVLIPRLNRPVNMQGSGGQPPTTRHDLVFDGIVATLDVGRFVSVLNKRCDAPTGPTGMGLPAYSSQTQ